MENQKLQMKMTRQRRISKGCAKETVGEKKKGMKIRRWCHELTNRE